VEAKPAARCIAPRNLPLVYEKEAERAAAAAKIINEFPQQGFLDDAKAIAVFPNLRKVAFILGGRWGRGLMTKRDIDGRWLPPSYIELTGGNFGFQVGLEGTDLVLVFTSQQAVDSILKGKFTLNADASGAIGMVGRKAQIGMPVLAGGSIMTFMSRSRGVFAGISLDGAAITIDNTSNERVYGKNISGNEILVERRVEVNEAVAPFMNALQMHSPGPRTASVQEDAMERSPDAEQ
jgi:lipid-binding SYLF domain-containing protein